MKGSRLLRRLAKCPRQVVAERQPDLPPWRRGLTACASRLLVVCFPCRETTHQQRRRKVGAESLSLTAPCLLFPEACAVGKKIAVGAVLIHHGQRIFPILVSNDLTGLKAFRSELFLFGLDKLMRCL